MDFQRLVNAKHFHLIRVADGVYAAIANEGAGAVANAGVIDLGNSIVVFDTFNTQQAALELRNVIHGRIGKPISHVINSHWHGDHIRGNQVFRDVSIVTTEQTRNIMQEVHPARIAAQQAGLKGLRDYIQSLEGEKTSAIYEENSQLSKQISFLKEMEISLPTLELVIPNQTFESEWQAQGVRRRVECRTLGGGHTVSDTFLYVPDVKVCFIGDLVAINHHMLVVDGDINQWLSILNQLNQWEIDYVIPGHGPVGGKEWIGTAQCYLHDLLESVYTLRANGIRWDELDHAEIPEKYRDWTARDNYLQNIRHLLNGRSYDEL